MINLRRVLTNIKSLKVGQISRYRLFNQKAILMSHFCSKNKYDNKFDKFMKETQSKISEEEAAKRRREADLEMEEQSKKAKVESSQAKQRIQDTQQTFQDFSEKKGQDEMNIKDLFKNINLKDHINEASTIFKEVQQGAKKRVNSILEVRKQLFTKEKKEEIKKIIKEEAESEMGKTEDSSIHKSEDAKDTPTEEAKAKEEAPSEPKISRIAQIKESVRGTTKKINEKAPFIYKTGVFFKDLWKETFPNDEGKVKTRLERRKEQAKEQMNYTPEEIDQMQENIPDWKRTAVTVVDDDAKKEEDSGYFIKLYRKVGQKVSDTEIAKKIVESEEYKELKKKYREVKSEASEFKSDLKDEVENTQNPVVGSARTVGDYIFQESTLCRAITKMKEYDPEFDIMDLHYEVEEVFTDLFDHFLSGNLEYCQKCCGEAALAVIKTEFMRREKEGWEPKFKELLFCSDSNLVSGDILDDAKPRFIFTISAQEINCKVSRKNPEEIVEGHEHNLEKAVYKITIRRHDDPDMAHTGHYWEIIEFEKHEAVKQLV